MYSGNLRSNVGNRYPGIYFHNTDPKNTKINVRHADIPHVNATSNRGRLQDSLEPFCRRKDSENTGIIYIILSSLSNCVQL